MSGHNTVAREDCEISCASHAAEGGRDASAAGERVNAHTANAPIAAFTPASYVRDNVIGLAAFLLALASTVLILPALGVNSSGVLLVADILTLIALGAGFLDYRRKAAFYHELHHLTEQLRQACVLPSLIAEPPFLEGEIAYDVARRLSQLSAEETAALRDDAAAYRRYVELWIHEIKTPIAAIKLMLANHPGPESAKVARELERIEAQVDQALYYARSTSVERDYAIREVNLADAAREACKRHSRFLIEKGCTPAFDIPDALTVLATSPGSCSSWDRWSPARRSTAPPPLPSPSARRSPAPPEAARCLRCATTAAASPPPTCPACSSAASPARSAAPTVRPRAWAFTW